MHRPATTARTHLTIERVQSVTDYRPASFAATGRAVADTRPSVARHRRRTR